VLAGQIYGPSSWDAWKTGFRWKPSILLAVQGSKKYFQSFKALHFSLITARNTGNLLYVALSSRD
jgi:hypothetical protein